MENESPKNDSTIFATKVTETPTETPTSPQEGISPSREAYHTAEHIEQPPSIRSEPYIVEMLELGEAANHFKMPELIQKINEYVLSEFERNEMSDTVDSYKEIIENYLDRLKLPDGIDVYTKIERLAEIIRIDKKLLDAAKAKEELLQKPIEQLDADQLKEMIKNGTLPKARTDKKDSSLPGMSSYVHKAQRANELRAINKKLIDAAKERERILNADPSKLNSKQLKSRIEGTL